MAPRTLRTRIFFSMLAVTAAALALFTAALPSITGRAAWVGAGALAGALLLAAFFSTWLARPVVELAERAAEISKGRFDLRAPLAGSREVEEVSRVLHQMTASLGDLDRVKDDFTHMVAHDLRTPLNAIVSYTDTLRDERRGPLNEAQKDYLATIIRHAKSLTRFINDMLDLATIQAGRMEYRFENLPVDRLLADPVALLKDLAERQGTRLEISVPAGLLVQADPPKIERVITNLLSNALKFVPAGEGLVRVSAEDEADSVRVRVTDNGPGISADDQARLFEKFVRLNAHHQDRAKIDGTGLGLYLVKSIIESHGGRVAVDSAPGRGTTFSFTLCRAP